MWVLPTYNVLTLGGILKHELEKLIEEMNSNADVIVEYLKLIVSCLDKIVHATLSGEALPPQSPAGASTEE